MIKIKIASSLLMLVALTSSTVATPSLKANAINGDQSISGDEFVSVDNFVNSGKGFSMEFTFTAPTTEYVRDDICFMRNDWKRLTNYFYMTFYSDGRVSTPYGHVYKIEDKYYFQLMFEDLAPLINTGEGVTGTETVDFMYIRNANVKFENITTTLIESEMNVSPNVEVRDGTNNGLRFKSHIPNIKSGHTYGHIIVPRYYVAKYNSDYINHLISDGHNYHIVEANPVTLSSEDELYQIYGPGYSISASLVSIKEENYFLDYCAIPFERYNDNYVYGNGIKDASENIYHACVKTIESNTYSSYTEYGKAYIDNIISACENHDPVTSLTNSQAFSAYNSERVTKESGVPASPSRKVKMQAGRNEREGAQIILNSSLNGNEYYVNFEPFVNEDKTSKIPASNIKAYKQLYQNVDSNWTEYTKVKNETYINGYEELPLGYYPDAILPFNVAIDAWENKLNTEGGDNNGIYFTVDIPNGIEGGKYTSNAIIQIKNEGTIVMPIELTVYDFTLPNKNYSKMVSIINTSQTKYLYGDEIGVSSKIHKAAYDLLEEHHVSGGQLPAEKWAKSDLPNYIEAVKKYTLDDDVSVFFFPDCYESMSVELEYQYKKVLSPKTKTVNLVDMPIYVGKDYLYSDGKTELYGLETLFTELVKASTPNMNLLEKGIFYFPQADEPGTNEANQVQNILCQSVVLKAAENVLNNPDLAADFNNKPAVKDSLEYVRYITTSNPRGLLRGKAVDGSNEYNATLKAITPNSDNCDLAYLSSDISTSIYQENGSPLIKMRGYCPQFDCFQPVDGGDNKFNCKELMNMIPDKKNTIWWYGCCMPVAPFPVNFLNSPMIRYRVNKWLEYSLGIQGQLYYMCNRTCKVINDEHGEVQYPCTEEEIIKGLHHYNGAYGDGVLIYPVYNTYKNIDPNLYWISSLKLENWSEANDDYNYLHYVNTLIDRLPSSEQEAERNKVKNYIASLTIGAYYNTKDSSALYTQKGNLISLIATLANK